MPTDIPFVFFGTPEVGEKTLAQLIQHGYKPSLVVTAPDRPRGRGLLLSPTPVKALALSHDLPCITPAKLDDEVIEAISGAGASYAIVVAYGKILPERLLEQFPKGVLNVHYSLLPKYRGASPVEAALLSGDTTTGVTIQRMVYELDAGDIVAQSETVIGEDKTAIELRERLIAMGAELLIETLPRYLADSVTLRPQNEAEATRCGKIQKEDRALSLREDSASNWRKYRAYAEGPGTHFFAERSGKRFRVKIKTATHEGDVFTPLRVVPEGKAEQDFQALLASGAVPL